MAKRFFLVFIVRGHADPWTFEVRKDEWERLRRNLGRAEAQQHPGVFFFDTVAGRSVAINLGYVQAVRYLWDPSKLPMDGTRDDGDIEIYFLDRAKPLIANTAAPELLWDFFTALESFPFGETFPEFEDEDGELVQVNPVEVVIAPAPTHLLDEGREAGEPDEADGP